jgi:hypothetical protein
MNQREEGRAAKKKRCGRRGTIGRVGFKRKRKDRLIIWTRVEKGEVYIKSREEKKG